MGQELMPALLTELKIQELKPPRQAWLKSSSGEILKRLAVTWSSLIDTVKGKEIELWE